MLAETAEKAFTDPAWLFELKYDGFRVLAERQGGAIHLVYRRGSDAVATYPDVARALAALPFGDLVLDGEVVVLDDEGRPSFQRLQRRAQQRRTTDIQRAALEMPATYFAFDLLGFEGFDLRALPLVERKRLLQMVLPRAGPVRFLDHVPEQGEAFYAEVSRLKLEGLIAKRADAPYRAGRSPHWLKLRTERVDDFVVVGFTRAAGRAHRLRRAAPRRLRGRGARLLRPGGQRLRRGAARLPARGARRRAAGRRRPARGPLPTDRGHVWVEPRLVAEVRYLTWTDEGLLRQPVFLRLRDDKRPDECPMPPGRRDGSEDRLSTVSFRGSSGEPGPEESAVSAPVPADLSAPDATGAPRDDKPFEKKVPFSNLTKVFWPDEGYTKGDLIEYYRAISPWLLPYLKDRLLVLTRFPDGIKGKSFFQKDAPSFAPGWVRLERVWSESAQREIDYFVAGDVESLLYIANLGTIPLHVWGSRIDRPRPPGLVHPRPRPEDGALRPRRAGGAGHPRARGGDRPARLREDVGLDRPSRARPARGAVHLRPVQAARRAAGPRRGRPAPGHRHDHSPAQRPGRARVPRLPAERPRQAAGRSLHRATGQAAPCAPRPSSGRRWTRRWTSARSRSGRCPSGCRSSAATRWPPS